jgi:hypothetical protein
MNLGLHFTVTAVECRALASPASVRAQECMPPAETWLILRCDRHACGCTTSRTSSSPSQVPSLRTVGYSQDVGFRLKLTLQGYGQMLEKGVYFVGAIVVGSQLRVSLGW